MFRKGITAMDGLFGRGKAICCLEAFSTLGSPGGKANRQTTAAPAANKRTLARAINLNLRLAPSFGFA
jgi:hypothetical protein